MIRIFKHYVPISLLLLGFAESLLLIISFYLGNVLHAVLLADYIDINSIIYDSLYSPIYFVVLFTSLMAMGLYRRRLHYDLYDWLLRIVLAFVASGLVLLLGGVTLFSDSLPSWNVMWTTVTISFVGIVILRLIFFVFVDQTYLTRRILILGTGEAALEVAKLRRKSDHRGCSIIGFLNVRGEPVCVDDERIIKENGSLVSLVDKYFIDEIVVAIKDRRNTLPVDELLECKMHGVRIIDLSTYFERQLGMLRLDLINPSWMVFSDGFKSGLLKDFLKRGFDILASFALLFVAWPFMVLAALAIIIESKGHGTIFYQQIRVGERGKPFGVLKFRSMRMDAEKNGAQWAKANDDRITVVGKFIRTTRIDELPQLLNVFRGDMSFVGPRPERPEFVEQLAKKIPYFNDRHMVKPGITGWAQISYPYGACDEDSRQKLQYDLYYVKNYSLFLDVAIMLQTAEVILWGKGAR